MTKVKRRRKCGFLKRSSTADGLKILRNRRRCGRKVLCI